MRNRLVPVIAACAAVLLVLDVSVWLAGAAPREILRLLVVGTLGSGYGVGQTLSKATPLLWTGAAVAFALRARMFNIGAEGQCLLGVLAGAVVGAALPAHTPWILATPVCLAACALAGASAGALAGWLRGRFGTHEVISTLMLNGLVTVLTTWLYSGPLRVGAQVHTRDVVAGARLPQIASAASLFRGSTLNLSLVFALLASVGAWWYLRHTRGGLTLRALGSSRGAAAALGVSETRVMTRTMAISGALAGLAGSHFALGVKGYAEHGLGAGVGFVGIAVALLGGDHPLGLLAAAALFGALAQGSLAVNAAVPADVLTMTQAAAIVAVAAVTARHRLGGAAARA